MREPSWARPERSAGEWRDLGFDPSGLDKLRARFEAQFGEGLHPGAQLALYRHGRFVLELGGGLGRQAPRALPVGEDTVFVLLSATKAWAAVSAHLLAERGQLDYHARVADYWPEFAEHGKGEITVRQALSHRGGYPMPAWVFDPDAAVVGSELQWQPDSANAYHFSNFGDTIAGLVRRIDGRTIQDFIREEIFAVVGMPDSFLGERPDRPFPDDRVAWIYEIEEGSVGSGFVAATPSPDPEVTEFEFIFNRPDVQRVGGASGGGLGSAHDLARFYGALAAGGEIDGRRLLEPATIETATARTNRPGEVDLYMQLPIGWSMGFHLGGGPDGFGFGATSTDRCFGHAGGACTVGWADPDLGIGFALLTNGNMPWGPRPFRRTGELADLVREAALS